MEDQINIKRIVEAFLFASDSPITLKQMKEAIGVEVEVISSAVEELKKEYEEQNRSFMIAEIASGYQIITRSIYANWLKKLVKGKYEAKFSAPALETLAIIAYKQPVTRLDVESIRGVNTDGVVKTLFEKGYIRIAGRREVPGRPFVYGTTKKFLEQFGLNSLEDLPSIEKFTQQNAAEVLKEVADEKLSEPAQND